jgi:hypothetical protein
MGVCSDSAAAMQSKAVPPHRLVISRISSGARAMLVLLVVLVAELAVLLMLMC